MIKSLNVACNVLKKSNEILYKPVGNKDAFDWRRLTWIANYNMIYRFTSISYNYGATLLALRAPLQYYMVFPRLLPRKCIRWRWSRGSLHDRSQKCWYEGVIPSSDLWEYLFVSIQVRSIMRKEMEKAGVKDPQILDKSYWIQRVGEVCRERGKLTAYLSEINNFKKRKPKWLIDPSKPVALWI